LESPCVRNRASLAPTCRGLKRPFSLSRKHSSSCLMFERLFFFPFLCGRLRLRMPRIPPTLLRHARRIDRLLPPLLPVCRDLQSSRNELRWLGEHAAEVVASQHAGTSTEKHLLRQYVNRRAKGEPLQYILGTEFFGDLEIKCRPGVLIPRLVDVFRFLSRCILISYTVDKRLLLLYLTLLGHSCSLGGTALLSAQ
jgi:hypothetical protein